MQVIHCTKKLLTELGALGKVYQVFGDGLNKMPDELYTVLAA